MKKLSQLSMIICAMLFFCACSEDGINGEHGPQGETGNANVVTKQATLQNSDYVSNSFGSQMLNGNYLYRFSKMATIADDLITQDVIDNGVVLVYIKTPTSFGATTYTWTPLPTRFLNTGAENYTVWEIKVREGFIDIHVFFEANTGEAPLINNTNIITSTFKYVIITGNDAVAYKESVLAATL